MTTEQKPTPDDLRARIEAALPPEEFKEGEGADGYQNAAEHAAKVVLGIANRNPVAFKGALDDFREHPYGNAIEGLMTEEERTVLMDGRYGITGNQWGWAVGAVAYLTEQPPVPNPAIITIGSREPAP